MENIQLTRSLITTHQALFLSENDVLSEFAESSGKNMMKTVVMNNYKDRGKGECSRGIAHGVIVNFQPATKTSYLILR